MSKKFNRWSRRIERNILAVYHRANSYDIDFGMLWYQRAHESAQAIAERHGIEIHKACGVIAAISPGSEWGRNLIEADALISAFVNKRSIPMVGAYGRRNVIKALAILRGKFPLEILPSTGPKTRAFFANLLFPKDSLDVTVDRHAKALAFKFTSAANRGASDSVLSAVLPSEYDYIAWHYKVIARRFGILPSQLQSICWVTWKRLQGVIDQQDLPF